ncbi:MAG: LytTR family transcriptional regulator DNA-binding domain-containing protein [Clostridia bacterium]|nr:LytTR family transcriptional regulator DNA-binding domain-containing protein [Clostridia bacterium]
MKVSIFIDKNREEEIQIFAHNESDLTEQIKSLVSDYSSHVTGYKNAEIFLLKTTDVYCFLVENNKVFAMTENDKFLLKERLYNIENSLSFDFIKINKSCIANIKKIERFDASISGTLVVKFKNGYTDYVSRRSVKTVKERLSL